MQNRLDDLQNILLMGAGPSGVAPSTYRALSLSTLGHLDPTFIALMGYNATPEKAQCVVDAIAASLAAQRQ